MTVLRMIEYACPVCDNRFVSPSVESTDSQGGKRTDFHERASGTQPLQFFVHTCVRCGYSGRDSDFGEDVDVSMTLKEHVWSDLAPLVTESQTGSERYEAAAKVAMWRASDSREVADLFLRAAWCCVDENDVEAERYYRRKAAWAFEEALDGFDSVARTDRAVLTYLVGELWRRVGDRVKAHAWLSRVASEIVDMRDQRWILDAARQQRDFPREWFA